MKDYLFSEMLDICREYDDCVGCPFETICQNGIASVSERDIKPRDIIELPCKIPYINAYDEVRYFVLYMKDNGFVSITNGYTENDADKLLLELSNAKSN